MERISKKFILTAKDNLTSNAFPRITFGNTNAYNYTLAQDWHRISDPLQKTCDLQQYTRKLKTK